jgi:poly-gamma-glutamate synthesis protein (capsule biosynthesis protein)
MAVLKALFLALACSAASLQAAEQAPDYGLPQPLSGAVRVAFAGDIILGRRVARLAEQKGWDWMAAGVRPLLAQADLVVANLESPVGQGGVPYAEKAVYLRASPSGLALLKALGVGVVTLGNNHILDYGPELMGQTQAGLDALGIKHCGTVEGPGQAQQPALAQARGKRLAFLGYCSVCPQEFRARGRAPGVAVALPSEMLPEIRAARRQADFVVVLPHWGQEYHAANELQRKLALGLSHSGADAVVGSHPHVLQVLDRLGRMPCAYSMADLIFDLSYPVSQDSALLFIDFLPGQAPQCHAVALDLSSGRPLPLDPASAQGRRILGILAHGYDYQGLKTYGGGE